MRIRRNSKSNHVHWKEIERRSRSFDRLLQSSDIREQNPVHRVVLTCMYNMCQPLMASRAYSYLCISVNNPLWTKVVNYLLVSSFIISVAIRVNMHWSSIMELYKALGLITNRISRRHVNYYGHLYNISNEKKLINFIIV